VYNSQEEENFIADLIRAIKRLNIENILSKEVLKQIIQTFANNTDRIGHKYSKISKQIEDWKLFKSIVKKTKCNFFNQKIQEIANKNCSPWELMK